MNGIHTILVLHMVIQSLSGKCSYSNSIQAECISVEEEQLFAFMRNLRPCSLDSLKIENSFIPLIEIFPVECRRLNSLTIRNSRIRSILDIDEGLGGYKYLYELDLSFNDIRDMNFLGNISNLERVVMHHNQIEFLKKSNLQRIVYLDLSYNNIKNFDQLKWTNYELTTLNLSHNALENIGGLLIDLANVGIVDFSYNKLNTLIAEDFKNSRNIKILNLQHNNIVSFQFEMLNHRMFYEMSILYLSYNKVRITKELFSNLSSTYSTLFFEKNGLQDLNFFLSNENINIFGDSFIFHNNKIKMLHPLNFKGIRLKKLDLSSNEIEHILPSTFEGSILNELCLDRNKIMTLHSSSFFGLSGLNRLNLSFNPLTTIDGPVFRTLRLWSLDLSHCLLKNLPHGLFENMSLDEIYLNHNNIESIELKTFPSLKILDLSNNKIKSLQPNIFSGIKITTYLNLSDNPIKSLKNVFDNTDINNVTLTGISLSALSEKDLTGLDKLKYLDLSRTGIEDLGNNTFDKLSLKTLRLDDNSIRIIPSNFFNFNDKLVSLSMIRNPISIIPLDSFSHKMKLTYLYLTVHGKILKKRFFNLIFLKELHIVHSQITELHKYSFKGLVNLKKLNFKNSTILKIEPGAFVGLRNVVEFDTENLFANVSSLKTKSFIGLDSLESLNFSKVGIGIIEDGAFIGLDSLLNLNLSYNKIGKLPKNAFMGLKKLKILDLSNNNLTGKESTFPIGTFRDLVELTDLHLQHNRIIKFHIGEFSNMRNLRFLNLSHNQLSYLDRHLLFPLRNLEVLDINSNHVIKFDYHFTFKHLPMLKTIGIGENKWPCENMTIMLSTFEENAVDYRRISKLEFEVENIGGIYCVHVCNYLYCPTEEDLILTI